MRSGHDGTPGQGRDFGDFLRRELHAAADKVEPHADGLERIRARVGSGPAYASRHAGAPAGLWSKGFLPNLVRRWRPRPGAGPGGEPGHARRAPRQTRDWREALLRPAIAIGFAVFAIGVVLAAVPPFRSSVSGALDGHQAVSAASSAGPGSGGKAFGTGTGAGATGAAGTTPAQRNEPTPLASCSPSSASPSPAARPSSASPTIYPSHPPISPSTAPPSSPTSPPPSSPTVRRPVRRPAQ